VASSRRAGVRQNAPVVNPGYIPKQYRARQSCRLEVLRHELKIIFSRAFAQDKPPADSEGSFGEGESLAVAVGGGKWTPCLRPVPTPRSTPPKPPLTNNYARPEIQGKNVWSRTSPAG
jgi:hypothetical protein